MVFEKVANVLRLRFSHGNRRPFIFHRLFEMMDPHGLSYTEKEKVKETCFYSQATMKIIYIQYMIYGLKTITTRKNYNKSFKQKIIYVLFFNLHPREIKISASP